MTRNGLTGVVKIYGTKLYAGCGHAAVKGFDWCPRCRISELEANLKSCQKTCDTLRNIERKKRKRISELEAALHFYADDHRNPNDGPWGAFSSDFGKVAREALNNEDES